MQESLVKLLRENSVGPEIALWIYYLSLYSEEKKYINWLENTHKYFTRHA